MARVRQVISRSTCKVVYKFPSIKLRRMVYCESGLELDYVYLLDADHDVISFQEQPGKIRYYLNGELHEYTPDFLVIRPHKKQIVEVKPISKASTEEYRILFGIIEAICHEAGYEFIVATEVTIREESRLSNVKVFWRYGRTPIGPPHHIYCQEFFNHKPQATLGELFEFFDRKGEEKGVVFSLLYRGVVGIDIKQPLTTHSPIYLPS